MDRDFDMENRNAILQPRVCPQNRIPIPILESHSDFVEIAVLLHVQAVWPC
jgi:hypothetical protein